ncbi:hypothetical protein ACFV30_41895 [Streptomyces sp. NPDC059752]|uniref:hypothetical protein n=1 Tax=unclassified Streptomyces TaxID=2593676 RepID=UPI00365D8C45
MASVAGLLTTGVATLFSALVARDQLAQSQEVAAEKKREHAARVSYWVDVLPDGTPRLHLTNRSTDPISNAIMLFSTYLPDLPDVGFTVKVPSVQPCSDLVFTSKDMRYSTDENQFPPNDYHPFAGRPDAAWLSFDEPPRIDTDWVAFTDRNGGTWERSGEGILTQRTELDFDQRPGLPGLVLAVQPQSLKACADAASRVRPNE